MIKIAGSIIDSNLIMDQYTPNSMEWKIANSLFSSEAIYQYDSENQLKFELSLRNSIVNAARDLSVSRFSFRVFKKSKCNTDYWDRTSEGGFTLKSGIKPSDGIKDIYIHSSKYGTECSTAMVIIYYKALVDIYPEDLFNRLFPDILLMNWRDLENAFDVMVKEPADYLPGDSRYFKNPDVDPLYPQWQGENVIDMGNGLYYGNGIGITNGEGIIKSLNTKRIKDSEVSAYLMQFARRQNYKYLSNQLYT